MYGLNAEAAGAEAGGVGTTGAAGFAAVNEGADMGTGANGAGVAGALSRLGFINRSSADGECAEKGEAEAEGIARGAGEAEDIGTDDTGDPGKLDGTTAAGRGIGTSEA